MFVVLANLKLKFFLHTRQRKSFRSMAMHIFTEPLRDMPKQLYILCSHMYTVATASLSESR